MSTTGNIDGYIEVVLKINDYTGEIEEIAAKTMDGELIDLSKLEDPNWWAEQAANWGNVGITYALESMNNTVNYSNLTKFLTGEKSHSELNDKLADLAASNKDYSKWIKNYNTLYQGAKDLVSLSSDAIRISEGFERLSSYSSESERAKAIRDISSGFLSMGSTAAGHLPGITGELIAAQLETAVEVLENGCDVLINYIDMLEKLEDEIEEITGENEETIEGIEAINEVAEAFAPLLNGQTIDGLDTLNDRLNDYHNACYNYEREKNRDIDGDGKIADGKDYDPDNPGDGDGGAGDADEQFNDGKKKRVDPLVIDVRNDGFNPSSLSEGANFDLDCNGMAERINWIQGDDAFLAYDRNEDGIINDGRELFGDNTLLKNGEKALNGFEALAEFDSNLDGKIDNNDTDFSKLLVWMDSDKLGITEKDELISLADFGIESINLYYKSLNSNTDSGTVLGNASNFSYTGGSESGIAEYWVMSQKFNTVDNNPIDIPGEIAILPNINSMGDAYSLHKAMTLDTTGRLVSLVTEFSSKFDETERRELIDQILLILTGAESVEPGSRGEYIDAQKLAALECLMGQDFVGVNGENPNSVAAPILLSAYNTLADMYYCELVAKTSLIDVLNYIKVEETNGEFSLNLTIFNQALRFNLLCDEQGEIKLYDAAKYIKYLQTYYYDGCFDEFRQYFFDNCSLSVVQIIDKASGIALFGTDEDNVLRGTKDQYISYGNGGNDTLYGSAVNDLIYGESGNDTILAGEGVDIIYGGTGDDTIKAGADNDLVYGEDGNDTIDGGTGNDTLYGGTGDDTVNAGEGDDVVYGEDGNDTIDGGAGNDTIDAGTENDVISGGEGDDTLAGGEGDDTYHFGAAHGNDIVFDADGANMLEFGDELSADDYDLSVDINGGFVLTHKETGETVSLPDFVTNPLAYDFTFAGEGKVLGGGEEREVLEGTDEDNTLNAGDGFNIIYGNGGNDTIEGGENVDFVFGGDGDDTISGGNGTNILHGEAGNDTLSDGEGSSYLNGGDGDDTLFAGAGNDALLGGTGSDEMHGEDGDDVLAGNDGDDTLYGEAGADTLYADAGNDTLYGGEDDDALFGGDGDDTLHGEAGNDYLESGNGNDTMYGGDGDDTFVTGEDTDYVYGGAGNDYVIGGNGDNYMCGEEGDDRLQGGEGYDYMEGGLGNDNLSGGNGFNEMYGQEGDDYIYGGDHADYIDGGVGDDHLYGANATDGQNEIYGREGNDTIYDGDQGAYIEGNVGDDTIRASGGNDVIDGGTGNDYIQDDHGDDTVIFKAGYGTDTISDAAGNNTLVLSGLSIEDATAYKEGSNLKLAFSTGDNLIIKQYFDGGAFQNFSIDGVLLGDLISGYHGSENDDWMSASNGNDTTLYGDGGNDNISGNNGSDTLYGGSGNDTLNGGENADTLDGGEGTDSLYGGNGDDTYVFGKGYGADTIEDWNGSSIVKLTDINIDEVSISNSNDSALVLTVDSTGDTLTINGYKWNQGGYTFEFADGTTDTVNKDTWNWESGFGTSSDDTAGDSTGEGGTTQPDVEITDDYVLNGSANSEWLSAPNNNDGVIDAGDGDDGLNGGSSSDKLYGGAGTDNLYGNDGDDILDGGTGTDGLNGGNGTDTYIFAKGYGNDTVNEWGNDVSIIKLTDINSDEVTLNSQSENNLVISVNGTSDTLTISNYRWSQGSFTLEFADGAIATVNKETWEMEYSQYPTVATEETAAEVSEDEMTQTNAEFLTALYAEDAPLAELISETDNTMISEVTDSTTVADETDEVADQTDLQVMILTENMSAFAGEDTVFDGINVADASADVTLMSQLLVNSAV